MPHEENHGMEFNDVIDAAKRFAGGKKQDESYDDLLIDRLHNRYTVAILVCFCIALSTYDYIGSPIECWVPAQLADYYEKYINRLCYIQNTYHIPKHRAVPQDSHLRRERTLKYYQWIYFVFLLQALFFSLPRILWQSFYSKIGLPVQNLVDAAEKYQTLNTEVDRSEIIRYISDCLQRYEEYVNPPKREKAWRFYRQCSLFWQGRTGASMACFYISIKCLYILNIIFQIIFLQYFLSYHHVYYIQDGWRRFFSNSFTLPESPLFPRMTLCDFQVRELGERHSYTVECVLVINIFIEKMFFFLWLWFGILLLLTILDTCRILYRIFFRHSRNMFINENLGLIIKDHLIQEKSFGYFLRYFPIDNLFTLKIISMNSNSLIVGEIIHELYQRKSADDSDV